MKEQITLSYRDIVTSPLVPALQKLTQMSVFDGKTAHKLHKIHAKIREYYFKSMTEFDDIGVEYGQKDEKGFIRKNETNGQHFPIEGKEKEYAEKINNFLGQVFSLDQRKISIDKLTTRFSPEEIAALEPLLDGLEE